MVVRKQGTIKIISRGRAEPPPTSLSANWKAQFGNVVRNSASHSLPNQPSDLELHLISKWKPMGAPVACIQMCVNISAGLAAAFRAS